MEHIINNSAAMSLDSPSIAAPITASPLLDKLSVEVRMQIFRDVLLSRKTMYGFSSFRRSTGRSAGRTFETPALFTVCKLISTEALDAFFEENTAVIKVSRADSSYSTPDSDLVPLANCELPRNVVLEGWFVNDNVLTQAINFCEQLPKIKAIVVECDSNQMERVTLHLSTPSIVTGSNLTCINVGVYKVDTAASGKDYFERSKVVEIWKAFQAVDGTIGFDQAYAKHCANGWHARATPSRIVGRLSAAEFIALYDEWRSVKWPQP